MWMSRPGVGGQLTQRPPKDRRGRVSVLSGFVASLWPGARQRRLVERAIGRWFLAAMASFFLSGPAVGSQRRGDGFCLLDASCGPVSAAASGFTGASTGRDPPTVAVLPKQRSGSSTLLAGVDQVHSGVMVQRGKGPLLVWSGQRSCLRGRLPVTPEAFTRLLPALSEHGGLLSAALLLFFNLAGSKHHLPECEAPL